MTDITLPRKWLDNSKICVAETCLRKYYLRYVRHLVATKHESKAKVYGQAVHHGHAVFFKMLQEEGIAMDVAQSALIKATHEIGVWWDGLELDSLGLDEFGQPYMDWRDKPSAVEATTHSLAKLMGKLEMWKKIVAVEEPVIVQIPKSPYSFIFRADLVLNKLGSGVCIIDHKTTSWPIAGTMPKYEGDPQLPSYVMAWNLANPDYPVITAEYNFIYSCRRMGKNGYGKLSTDEETMSVPIRGGNAMEERVRRAGRIIDFCDSQNSWSPNFTACPTRYGLCSYHALCSFHGYESSIYLADIMEERGYEQRIWNPLVV